MFKELAGCYLSILLCISCGYIGIDPIAGDSGPIGDDNTVTSTNRDFETDSIHVIDEATIPHTDSDTNTESDTKTDIDTDENLDAETDSDSGTGADTGSETPLSMEPDALPGLVLWLDADDSSSIIYDVAVAEWQDRSGNNHHATQSIGDAQPALSVDGFGSRSAMEFDGIDDFLVVESYPALVGYDAFLVWQSPVLPSTERLTSLVRYGTEQFNTNIEITHGHDMASFRNAATFSMNAKYLVAPFDYPLVNTPYLWQMTFDSVMGRLVSHTNGYYSNQYGDFPGAPDSEGAGLGIGARADGIQHFMGQIGEIIIFDHVLNDTDRIGIQMYLQLKWNIDE
jgi:hypothetical protein